MAGPVHPSTPAVPPDGATPDTATRDIATPGHRARRRRLPVLLVLCLVLLVQGAYSFAVWPEPYPAVRMPAFGAAPDAHGRFPTPTLDITVDYTDGSSLSPHVAELMAEFRGLSARRSADFMFGPDDTGRSRVESHPEVREWLRGRAAELAPGRVPREVRFCRRDGDVDAHTGRYVDRTDCTWTRITW